MRNVYASLLMVALLVSCGFISSSVAVEDVTAEQLLILKKNRSGNTYALWVGGSGKIEGHATISLLLNGEAYKTERLQGKVKFEWSGDWYGDSAEIRYSPGNATGGLLRLRYDFSTL